MTLASMAQAARRFVPAILVVPVVVMAPAARAESLAGVTFPERSKVHGRDLVLNGIGLREATVFMVDVYVAGLYLPAKSSDPAEILKPDQPKEIAIRFVRSVGREKLTEAWTDGFDKNVGDKRAALLPELAKLNAAMQDVKKDDVLLLLYEPGTGVTVTVKDREVEVIPGEEFARVLFSIWLGANPPNVSLREGLLGRTATP